VPYFAKETLGVALGRIVGYQSLHDLGSRILSSTPVVKGNRIPGSIG
jgi:hypothetical protein